MFIKNLSKRELYFEDILKNNNNAAAKRGFITMYVIFYMLQAFAILSYLELHSKWLFNLLYLLSFYVLVVHFILYIPTLFFEINLTWQLTNTIKYLFSCTLPNSRFSEIVYKNLVSSLCICKVVNDRWSTNLKHYIIYMKLYKTISNTSGAEFWSLKLKIKWSLRAWKL